ncbi:CHAT domain-containing protein [Myxococcus sp. K15C18031901]|uniref:CHAT domain-containing protein n=1 Tax=Myxococcus dinghuensis TaxID=2906761 RepID=UPI0020A70A56|nr:CHAT domain-containing protein [Myxococcus dinghuensis]MCP3099894.1 CHAT domain-containing protein [Myxococcus dinghuensis]
MPRLRDDPAIEVLLRELDASTRRGDNVVGPALRWLLSSALVDAARKGDDTSPYSHNEYVVLRMLVSDLRRKGHREDADKILAALAGRALSERAWSMWCELQLDDLHAKVESLELDGALLLLESILDAAPGASSELLAHAARFDIPDVSHASRQGFRIRMLHALGCVWAARGMLGEAAKALDLALRLQDRNQEPRVVTEDLALLLGEVLLDRGNFDAFVRLSEERAFLDRSPKARRAWRCLEALLLHLQGRPSQAAQRLQWILEPSEQAQPRRLVDSATWLLSNVFLTLNRTDEAEALVKASLGGGQVRGFNHGQLLAVLDARREVTSTQQLQPPKRNDKLADGTSGAAPSKSPDPAPFRDRRESQRIWDDWSRWVNDILLDLHAGRLERARERYAQLSEWSGLLDSQVAATQFLHVGALVAYHAGGWETATGLAATATEGYARMGLSLREWEACDLWVCALRAHSPKAPELPSLKARSVALLEGFSRRLSDRDRPLAMLDKWSTLDDSVHEHCARLWSLLPSEEDEYGAPRGWRGFREESACALREVLSRVRWPWPEDASGAELRAARRPSTVAEAVVALRRPLDRPELFSLPFGVLSPDTAVLAYVSLPDRLELFLIQSSGVTPIRLHTMTGRVALWERVKNAQQCFYKANSWESASDNKSVKALTESLGIREVAGFLAASITHLCIIPDDVTFHAPFCALPLSDGTPLVRRFAISFLPLPGWELESRVPRFRSGLAVAVQSPQLGTDNLPPLADAYCDVTAVAALIPPARFKSLSREVTREAVMAELRIVELAHFACHGESKPSCPLDSGMALSNQWITVGDLRTLPMESLRLAVMGACWGAQTTLLPGREMLSLPAAFIQQGGRCAVAALWEIDTEMGGDFQRDFYGRLAKLGPVRALAETQRQWLLRPGEPTHWAGYVAYVRGAPVRAWARWPIRWWQRFKRFVARLRVGA